MPEGTKPDMGNLFETFCHKCHKFKRKTCNVLTGLFRSRKGPGTGDHLMYW